eukprot:TRINITY_DN1096_c0_g1_i13.p1 TRINITY_DN1096_c0_g1~~TRINITY_DN1096_c0_g1_i13.p1  ORF type:complete len:1017 (+),score=256.96 TRINITY_DN1096_c0_g1_i13:405-3455(+)
MAGTGTHEPYSGGNLGTYRVHPQHAQMPTTQPSPSAQYAAPMTMPPPHMQHAHQHQHQPPHQHHHHHHQGHMPTMHPAAHHHQHHHGHHHQHGVMHHHQHHTPMMSPYMTAPQHHHHHSYHQQHQQHQPPPRGQQWPAQQPMPAPDPYGNMRGPYPGGSADYRQPSQPAGTSPSLPLGSSMPPGHPGQMQQQQRPMRTLPSPCGQPQQKPPEDDGQGHPPQHMGGQLQGPPMQQPQQQQQPPQQQQQPAQPKPQPARKLLVNPVTGEQMGTDGKIRKRAPAAGTQPATSAAAPAPAPVTSHTGQQPQQTPQQQQQQQHHHHHHQHQHQHHHHQHQQHHQSHHQHHQQHHHHHQHQQFQESAQAPAPEAAAPAPAAAAEVREEKAAPKEQPAQQQAGQQQGSKPDAPQGGGAVGCGCKRLNSHPDHKCLPFCAQATGCDGTCGCPGQQQTRSGASMSSRVLSRQSGFPVRRDRANFVKPLEKPTPQPTTPPPGAEPAQAAAAGAADGAGRAAASKTQAGRPGSPQRFGTHDQLPQEMVVRPRPSDPPTAGRSDAAAQQPPTVQPKPTQWLPNQSGAAPAAASSTAKPLQHAVHAKPFEPVGTFMADGGSQSPITPGPQSQAHGQQQQQQQQQAQQPAKPKVLIQAPPGHSTEVIHLPDGKVVFGQRQVDVPEVSDGKHYSFEQLERIGESVIQEYVRDVAKAKVLMDFINENSHLWGKAPGALPGGMSGNWRSSTTRSMARSNPIREAALQAFADRDQRLVREVRGCIEELTPECYEPLEAKLCDIVTQWAKETYQSTDGHPDDSCAYEGVLREIVRQVYEAALTHNHFASLYANLCRAVAIAEAEVSYDSRGQAKFRRMLLNHCQQEFEELRKASEQRSKRHKETVQKGVPLTPEEEAADTEARKRAVGNIHFVGALFPIQMLTEKIMLSVFKMVLLPSESMDYSDIPEEDLIEAVAELLATYGKSLDSDKYKEYMNFYMKCMRMFSQDARISKPVQLKLQKLVELRENKWVPRQG